MNKLILTATSVLAASIVVSCVGYHGANRVGADDSNLSMPLQGPVENGNAETQSRTRYFLIKNEFEKKMREMNLQTR